MNLGGTGIVAVKAIVKGFLSYQKWQEINTATGLKQDTDKVGSHEVVVRCILTNSPAGSQTYTTITKYEQGETPPTGLAQY